MTKTVYYDLDWIREEDVARAVARAGPDVLHVHQVGTPWPANCPGRRQTIPALCETQTRSHSMHQLWDLLGRLPDLAYQGLDLRELTRYALFFAVEGALHRAWILSSLESGLPGELYWYTDSAETARSLGAFGGARAPALQVIANTESRARHMFRQRGDALRGRLWSLGRHFEEVRWSRQASRCRPLRSLERGSFVFAEYYPNSAKVSLSLAPHLRELSGIEPVFVSSRLEVVKVAQSAGMAAALLRDFPTQGAAQPSWRKLRSTWSAEIAQLADKPLYLLPGGPDCRAYFLPLLTAEALREFTLAVELFHGAQRMLEFLRPAAVATTTSGSTFGRTMTAAASLRGVKTAWIQHGLLLDDPAAIHLSYDALLVWGENDRRRLTEANTKGAIHTIGAPHFDDFVKRVQAASAAKRPLRDLPTLSVLYLASRAGGSNISAASFEQLLSCVVRVVRRIPRALLKIKLHPGDRTGIAQRVVGHLDSVEVVQSGSSQDLILECDIAIVTSSTTGLEACAAGKPLISLTPEVMPSGVDYAGYGAALCVNSEQELEAAMKSLLSNNGAEETLEAGRRRLVDDMLDGASGGAARKGGDTLARLTHHRLERINA